MERPQEEPRLFISRAGEDADFAAAIGDILRDAGYDVILQQWDFANRNFVERMHTALAEGARVVALLSPEYLTSDHCQAEWQNAIADDPLNKTSRLVLLRVADCEPLGLLRGMAYWDLVPIGGNRTLLEATVRDAVRGERRETEASGQYWRAPRTIVDVEAIRPVSGFTGRDAEIATLSAALANDAIALVHGLGGVGKSSLARECAWRTRDRYSVIWWLNAQSEDGIVEGLLGLGALFVRGLDRMADRRAAAQHVIGSALAGLTKPALLIFDNIEDERLLRAWRPRAGTHLLMTSRSAAWDPDIVAIDLGIWPEATAVAYLQHESGRADLEETDAGAIAQALGFLPLALAHAAASLRNLRMVTPQRYLTRIGEHLKSAPRGAEYPRSVFATFSTAIAQAEQQAPGAAAVLSFAAFYATDGIPDELFRQDPALYGEQLRPLIGDLSLDEALGALDRLSLLAFAPRSQTYTIHRLVQLAARDAAGDAIQDWRRSAVAVADAAFPDPVEFAAWPQCERLLAHARASLDPFDGEDAFLPAARLAGRCAVYLRARGEYDAAEPLCKLALATREKALGPDHPDVAHSLSSLATIYFEQGRYDEALPIHARGLAIREKALGPDHPDVAISLNNLATVYFERGRYDLAEPLLARALAIRENALGPHHADVASSLNNLATAYFEQGRYDEALPLHARALAIREKTLGPDHPDVAMNLNNFANVYRCQGRYGESESLLVRAVGIRERALGPDHPKVAISLVNLANVYLAQQRFGDAESLMTRALSIWERALGPEHPETAFSINDLANVYREQGRFEEASHLYARALAIRETGLGPDHPHFATSLSDLATLYERQGRLEEAEAKCARALEIREAALGHDHPLTKASREQLQRLRSRS